MFKTYKKISYILCFLMVVSNPAMAEQVADFSTGKSKLVNIMTHDETGVAAYNKEHIQYAETRNLSTDLNIGEIADFFECKTQMGHSFITETLKHPVSPEDHHTTLGHRQQCIKTLVENPQLKQEIEAFLTQAHEHEQEVIQLLSDYFKGKTCSEFENLALIKKQNPAMYPLIEWFHINPTPRTVGTAMNLLSTFGLAVTTYFFGKLAYGYTQMGAFYAQAGYGEASSQLQNEAMKTAFFSAYYAIFTGITGYQNYKSYSESAEKRLKMHALNRLIDIAEQFERIAVMHDMNNQFKISAVQNPDGRALIETLKHARYEHKDTKVFMTPLVHAFLYKIYEGEKYFGQIFACIAEMDAYNAIATKMIEHQEKNHKICFVTTIESEKPTFHARSFWNVLVKNPVVNTLSEDVNIILTGPNAGGKTTAIRSILQNIVLGQSFGVAAADEFSFTMFDEVHSYLHISDDLINGLSLFASEVKRAQEVLQKIRSLEPGKKFFFALDELFTGTVAEDGESCAYQFIDRIAGSEGVQFIYATHFNKLKQLGDTNPYCANYKVDTPERDENDVFVYPFTLNKGASTISIGLDLAKDAGLFD